MANILTRILNAAERAAFHGRMAEEGEARWGWSQHFHHTNTARAMGEIAGEAPKVSTIYAQEVEERRAKGVADAEAAIGARR